MMVYRRQKISQTERRSDTTFFGGRENSGQITMFPKPELRAFWRDERIDCLPCLDWLNVVGQNIKEIFPKWRFSGDLQWQNPQKITLNKSKEVTPLFGGREL